MALSLSNRLVLTKNAWERFVGGPLPKLAPGDPAAQVEEFELILLRELEASATAERAKDIADITWDMVHDRPDGDPVKQAVSALHGRLALLAHGRG